MDSKIALKYFYNFEVDDIDNHCSSFMLDYHVKLNNVTTSIRNHIVNSGNQPTQIEFSSNGAKYTIRIKKDFFDNYYRVSVFKEKMSKIKCCNKEILTKLHNKLNDKID
jgi:hypothetical protein